MRPSSASTSALPSDTLTAEQRKQRLIESRKKYSTRPTPRQDSFLNSSKNSSSSNLAPPPPNFSRPLAAPRMSRAPSDSRLPPPRHQNSHQNPPDDEFRIDHRSMAMIESGNVVIPRREHRPSMFGGRRGMPRNTIGGGGGGGGINNRALKFRNSIAPQQEPRQSLFPLGINIFTASEAQKSEVEGWLKERIEAATPAKAGSKSTSLLLDATKSTQRIVRFKEATPTKEAPPTNGEDEEDQGKENQNLGDSEGDTVVSRTMITEISRIKKLENFASPVSILKMDQRKKTTFSATPIPIRRRINFDEEEDDELTTSSKNLQNPQNPEKNSIEELKRLVTEITAYPFSPTPLEIEELQKIAENLAEYLKKHHEIQEKERQKKKTTASSSTTTQLVPICEDEDEEEEEEEEEVDVKTFGGLKIGEISPQKLLQHTPSGRASSSPMSESDLDQAFLD